MGIDYLLSILWELTILTQGAHTRTLRQSEGWNGDGDGREVLDGEDMGIPMADYC